MNYSIFNGIYNCIDAGSENCPCYLAVTGDCLTCSRIQGKDYCDCNWKGVCIYNEFIQGNRRINNPRRDFEAPIAKTKFYKDDLVVYVLDVGKGFAIKASRPGSYIFMKSSNSNSFYNVPISIMKADIEKGQIHLAIKIISAKTKALLAETEKFIIRGIYRNGIQGISPIIQKKIPNHKVLIIAKGIGIAPGILLIQFLSHKRRVDMIIDTDKISKELISDYLDTKIESIKQDEVEKEEGTIKFMSFAEETSLKELEEILQKNNYDSILILTSDYYIETYGKLIRKILPGASVGVSNNFHICCGEGLCGSCSLITETGDSIKMCKCQLTGTEILNSKSNK